MKSILEFVLKLWRLIGGGSPNGEEDEEAASASMISQRKPAIRQGTSRWISFLILLAIVVGMGIMFYRVMSSFFLPLFMALLLTVMFRPLHIWFMSKFGGYRQISAGLTTAIVLLIVLAPLAWAATLAVKEGVALVSNLDMDDVETRLERIRKTLGVDMQAVTELVQAEAILVDLADSDSDFTTEQQHEQLVSVRDHLTTFQDELPEQLKQRTAGTVGLLERTLATESGARLPESEMRDALIYIEQLKQITTGGPVNAWLTQQANPSEEQLREWRRQTLEFGQQHFATATGATTEFVFKFIVGLLIMVVGLYFFLADGEVLLDLLTSVSPLDEVYERELLLEFDRVSRAVVLATILSALTQAILAGIGFWFVGIEAIFLLMMLTFVLAMIPFVGAASVWIPVSLYLWLYNDQLGAGIFLAIYGTVIISLSDNVVKPLVLHGQSKLHPLLALLSIIGGMQALGPLGIFIGPMIVVFLQTLLKLLHREIMALEESDSEAKQVAEKPSPDTADSQSTDAEI